MFLMSVFIGVSAIYADSEEEAKAAMEKDKTGTNPVNFKDEFRIYNEYMWLNTKGDGSQNVTTVEVRGRMLDGKLQLRARGRYTDVKADLNDDGKDEVNKNGIGDFDFRLLAVPYMDLKNMQAVAVGLEFFLPTASDPVLGSGTFSLGPQIFYAKFFKRGMFAPGLQYKYSVDEDVGRDKTDQVVIDLNLLIMAENKLSWFFTDPQIIIDNEKHTEYAIIDLEYGFMMKKWFDLPGQSVYIRPSFGIGVDRPSDASLELGYKFIF